MCFILLLLMILVPVAEIYVVVKAWPHLGWFNTVGLLVLDVLLGVHFVRRQGTAIVRRIQEAQVAGKAPGRALIDGLLVLAGGGLLAFPGFISDVIGWTLIIPFTRFIWRSLAIWFIRRKSSWSTVRFRRF